jgi:hypothetical protein
MEKILRNRNDAKDRFVAQPMYAQQLITVNDLAEFKKQLIDELALLFKSQTTTSSKRWMKSHEVRRLLKISSGTLQTLKSNGVIPYTKIGGVHFFDYEDIQRVLESGKINYRV